MQNIFYFCQKLLMNFAVKINLINTTIVMVSFIDPIRVTDE